MDLKAFEDRLREERERLGYSQEDFGLIGGVKKLSQLKYEKGETSPTAAYLSAISSIGVDVVYLITGRRSLILGQQNHQLTERHERLKFERLRLGVALERMAVVGNISRIAQTQYEAGEKTPDIKYMAAIAELGVDVMYILTGVRAAVDSSVLSPRETALLNNFKNMADEDKRAFERLADAVEKPVTKTGTN